MTSEKSDAHARFPHCACVKKKKEAKVSIEPQPPDLQAVVQTTGPRGRRWFTSVKIVCRTPSDATLQVSFPISEADFPSVVGSRFWKKKKRSQGAEDIELAGYGSLGWEATTVPRRQRRPSEKNYIIYSSGKEVVTNKRLIAEKWRRTTIFDISVLLHYWVVAEDPQAMKTGKHRTFQKIVLKFNNFIVFLSLV